MAILDTYTDANGTALTAHTGEGGASWSVFTSGAVLQVQGNAAKATTNDGNADAGALFGANPASSADYDVLADFVYAPQVGTGSNFGVVGRASGYSFYWFVVLDDGAGTLTFAIYKRTSGAGAALATGSTMASPASGTTISLRLSMVGTSIKGYVNGSGTAVVSATDSTYAAKGLGGVAFGNRLNVGSFDNFAINNPAPLSAGSISLNSTTSTTANLTVSEATGGTAPYSRQWHRSTTTGFTPGVGSAVSGATGLTLNDTGLTSGTTYYYKVVQTDSAGTPASVTTAQQSATPGGSTTQTIAVNNANIFTTPGNWVLNGATSIESNWPGAYLKCGFTGSQLIITVDTSANPTQMPKIGYQIDGGTVGYVTPGSASASLDITLATGLAAGTHQAWVWIDGLGIQDRWNTPIDKLKIIALKIDAAGAMAAPTLAAKRFAVYGDSITEGASVLGAADTVANANWRTTWGALFALDAGAELSVFACQAQGYEQAGQANVPNLLSSYALVRSGVARTFAAFDSIFVLHGTNGTTTSSDVSTLLANLRAAVPAASLFHLFPFGPATGTTYARAAITSGFAAAAAIANKYLIDLGLTSQFIVGNNGATDGTHPNVAGHAALEAEIFKLYSAIVNGSSSGTFPSPAQVLVGVTFGPSANLTGTVVLPAIAQVQQGITFGASGALTGTFADPFAAVTDGPLTRGQKIDKIAAVLLGQSSGQKSGAPVFRNLAGTGIAVTAVVDSDGNRTSVTLPVLS